MADYDVPAALKSPPEIELAGCGDPPAELVTEDLAEGNGATVESSSSVTVNYTGVLWPDGDEFDSSWSRGEPTSFALSGVIPGWSEGLVGMKAGGRRLLVIPPDLAYGAQGAGGDIPPNSTLVFVVDVLEVEPPLEIPETLQEKPAVSVDPATPPPTTLEVQDEIVGSGPEAHAGDTVTVNYVGVAWSTGQEFDSSWQAGQPATFVLGQLVPGFNQGVEGMRVGGRRRIVIPPDLAYGAQGRPPAIAPNETLVFVVDLLDVESAGGGTSTTTSTTTG
ncbi:MAG: FKBP-type peptidyl-prolyl cis-trans isomerase [Acidimicrobiia bacterium]|nr:FKBP-type peptidyl-prolyl cis-trans isomerase [Acidimicrobiia bacterium]